MFLKINDDKNNVLELEYKKNNIEDYTLKDLQILGML